MKIVLFNKISILFLITLFSCAKNDFKNKKIQEDSAIKNFKSNDHDFNSKVIFKIASKRLVDIRDGIDNNALVIKWKRKNEVGDNKDDFFYTFHCDKNDDKENCDEIEKDLFKNGYTISGNKLPIKDLALSDKRLFPDEYSIVKVKPGKYYIDFIGEIHKGTKVPKDLEKAKYYTNLPDDLKTQKIQKDFIVSTHFLLPVGAIFAIQEIREPALSLVGLSFITIAFLLNGLYTGDYFFVGYYNSYSWGWDFKNNEPSYLAFEVKPNQNIYLGDIDMLIRARGGYGVKRRKALIELNIRNQLDDFINKNPEYRNLNIEFRKPLIGNKINNFEAGYF